MPHLLTTLARRISVWLHLSIAPTAVSGHPRQVDLPTPHDLPDYRLNQFPSSCYASRFRPQEIEHQPDGGWVKIEVEMDGTLDLGFLIVFRSARGLISQEQIRLAGELLTHIAELDAKARRPWADDPADEWRLNYVEITEEETRLVYAAGAFNSEMAVAVARGEDGSWGLVR